MVYEEGQEVEVSTKYLLNRGFPKAYIKQYGVNDWVLCTIV